LKNKSKLSTTGDWTRQENVEAAQPPKRVESNPPFGVSGDGHADYLRNKAKGVKTGDWTTSEYNVMKFKGFYAATAS
jgi:hypothetical protein